MIMKSKTKSPASYILACLFVVFISNTIYSQTPHKDILPHFYRGNLLYEKADYAQAIKEYQHILELGYESSAVYYNLANSYFKNNQLPQALLNYEKALRLAPRDRDIQANYAYVRSLVQTNEQNTQPKAITSIPLYMFKLFSLDELALITSFFYWLFLVVISLAIVGKLSKQKLILGGSCILLLLFLMVFALGQRASRIGKEAIVLDKRLEVRFEPFETATVYFELSQADKVNINSCKHDWCKIERADRKTGWVKKQALAVF